MTKIRRTAQLVEDLKTLNLITANQVSTLPSLNKGKIMVIMEVPDSDDNYSQRILIEESVKAEFSKEAIIIKDSECIQIIG